MTERQRTYPLALLALASVPLAWPARAQTDPAPSAEQPLEPDVAPKSPGPNEPEPGSETNASVPPSPPSEESGDIVESIDDGTSAILAPPAAVTAPAPAPRVTEERFELHGWARQSLEAGLGSDLPNGAPLTVPYDRFIARSQLFLRARYSRGQWFEANVSGALSYSLREQTVERQGLLEGFGHGKRGSLEPRLHELFVGFFSRRVDLRIGQQRLAWGKGEFLSPNDVVNARDTRDPFVSESELRSLPTFLLRADFDLGFGSFQAVVSPVFVPDRVDVYGSNWAAIQPDAPPWARGLAGITRRSIDPSLQDSTQPFLLATRLPASDFTEPQLGARFAWSRGPVDSSYYYHYGFDGPLVAMDPELAGSLAQVDFSQAGLSALGPWLAAIDAGQTPFRSTYVRRHHVGMDLAAALGPFVLRLDAAYQSRRVFYQRDLMGTVSGSFQAVTSLEYQTGDTGKLLLVEAMVLRMLDAPAQPLLIYDRNTFAGAAALRWPLWRALGVELRAVFGLRPTTAVLQPAVNADFDWLVLTLGGLWLKGEPYSLGDHFARNRELYFKAKVLF
jgi:hypothetical protein